MIESIEGAGLSGIAGKSGKQGKNSLFTKLLAMLEKHAEANGKGKSPGMGSPVLGKGKVVSVVGQSEALAATKGKQLLTMVSKDKSMQLKTDEESATPLFTSNVIIDAALQVKKAREAAKAGVVLPEQKSEAKTA
ncbi:MAG: hypothetical protein ACE5E3_02015, partial [Mariprofundus sp.]